jgi:hypothetical protein
MPSKPEDEHIGNTQEILPNNTGSFSSLRNALARTNSASKPPPLDIALRPKSVYSHYTGPDETFWGSGAAGLNPFRQRLTAVKPPEGFHVVHTRRGQPFVVPDESNKEIEVGEIVDEHVRKDLPLFCKWLSIEEEYGLGVRLYFDFHIMLIIFAGIFTCIQLINVVTYTIVSGAEIFTSDSGIKQVASGVLTNLWYTSNYDPSIVWLWRTCNIICILLAIFIGPFYWWFTRRQFIKRDLYDCEEHFVDDADNIIKENENVSMKSRMMRYLLSYSIFGLLLLVQLVVTLGLTILQNFTALITVVGEEGSKIQSNQFILTPLSLGISFAIAVINVIYSQIAVGLTQLEKHPTYSSFRAHNSFKLISFRLLNIVLLGFVKGFFSVPCIVTVLGNQYVIQVLLDFLAFLAVDIILPFVVYRFKKYKSIGNGSDEDIRPEFDVADMYLYGIYKQYVLYCGMVAFPLIALLSVIIGVTELYLIKLKLLKVCKKPPQTVGSVKSLASFFLIIAAILPLLNFGGGNVYQLVGYFWCNPQKGVGIGNDACFAAQCEIFKNVPGTGFFPSFSETLFPFLYGGGNTSMLNMTIATDAPQIVQNDTFARILMRH